MLYDKYECIYTSHSWVGKWSCSDIFQFADFTTWHDMIIEVMVKARFINVYGYHCCLQPSLIHRQQSNTGVERETTVIIYQLSFPSLPFIRDTRIYLAPLSPTLVTSGYTSVVRRKYQNSLSSKQYECQVEKWLFITKSNWHFWFDKYS